jgi:hypothetical protein
MIVHDDYRALVPRLKEILSELDRLQLSLVAVHVDLAICRLEEVIAGASPNNMVDRD